MYKFTLLVFIIALLSCNPEKNVASTSIDLVELQSLPEAITNNAVSEGFINDTAYVFTFGGLDSTKLYTGIHKRSYRLNLQTKAWQQIADLPDTLGKIASAASRIGGIIYIMGGYYVFADGSELSSNKVHRYDILNNKFLEDGASIPIAIDDHVQLVYKDSLIYLVSGWSDTQNVSVVQIYDPALNTWVKGSSVPDNHLYKSFGASGAIVADTIFYFGGAAMGKFYPIQNILRKGLIDKNNPSKIRWSFQSLDSSQVAYRAAATAYNKKVYWFGGSTITYNYNAIAYKGTGGVEPSNNIFSYYKNKFRYFKNIEVPMDLRGVAKINNNTRIIVGGIGPNQQVTTKVFQLTWNN